MNLELKQATNPSIGVKTMTRKRYNFPQNASSLQNPFCVQSVEQNSTRCAPTFIGHGNLVEDDNGEYACSRCDARFTKDDVDGWRLMSRKKSE